MYHPYGQIFFGMRLPLLLQRRKAKVCFVRGPRSTHGENPQRIGPKASCFEAFDFSREPLPLFREPEIGKRHFRTSPVRQFASLHRHQVTSPRFLPGRKHRPGFGSERMFQWLVPYHGHGGSIDQGSRVSFARSMELSDAAILSYSPAAFINSSPAELFFTSAAMIRRCLA